mgnify:CR=1 FL=1
MTMTKSYKFETLQLHVGQEQPTLEGRKILMDIVNLDHLSANPLLPEVQEAMISAIRANFGNPSSQHKLGDRASEALEKSRESVAR